MDREMEEFTLVERRVQMSWEFTMFTTKRKINPKIELS